MKRTPLNADPEKIRAFLNRGRVSSATSLDRSKRSQPPKRRSQGISPASPAQRRRVREIGFCVACGASHDPESGVWLTPAHLWPRGQGGCDAGLCVLLSRQPRLPLLPLILSLFRKARLPSKARGAC
jgi:hypothetical protein